MSETNERDPAAIVQRARNALWGAKMLTEQEDHELLRVVSLLVDFRMARMWFRRGLELFTEGE